ncbi:MAG: cob(I)yrinic acid a,c-diamide adenosyltransferase [Desulfobacterales bacterium]
MKSTEYMQGFVQVYTGNGKGKTTAAIGLAIRAAGAGLKVFIGQFIKTGDYSEIKTLKRLSDIIVVEQFGLGYFIGRNPTQEDVDAARRGVERVQAIFNSNEYNVVILEEASVAVRYGLISEEDLLGLIEQRPDNKELVITGRWATQLVIQKADLVTEMKDIKHYYRKGVEARVGIEK